MVSRKDGNVSRIKRHKRVRAKVSGTALRPAWLYIAQMRIYQHKLLMMLQA